MTKLYEEAALFREARLQIEEMDLDPIMVKDTLDSIQAPLAEKVENIVKFMKNLEADEVAYKAEADRLKEKADSTKKKREWLKAYLDENLKVAGISELKAGVFNIKYRKGSEAVQVDESVLPEDYWIPAYKPLSKTDLKKMVKEGKEIPGVSIVRNPDSLVIK
jgi:hypothetical protein